MIIISYKGIQKKPFATAAHHNKNQIVKLIKLVLKTFAVMKYLGDFVCKL